MLEWFKGGCLVCIFFVYDCVLSRRILVGVDFVSESICSGVVGDDGVREIIIVVVNEEGIGDMDEIFFVCVECESEDR